MAAAPKIQAVGLRRVHDCGPASFAGALATRCARRGDQHMLHAVAAHDEKSVIFSQHCVSTTDSPPGAAAEAGQAEAPEREARGADERQHDGERAEITKGIGHIHETGAFRSTFIDSSAKFAQAPYVKRGPSSIDMLNRG
jgi:hypothetical protein